MMYFNKMEWFKKSIFTVEQIKIDYKSIDFIVFVHFFYSIKYTNSRKAVNCAFIFCG